jgi:hypothetical protein
MTVREARNPIAGAAQSEELAIRGTALTFIRQGRIKTRLIEPAVIPIFSSITSAICQIDSHLWSMSEGRTPQGSLQKNAS